MPAVVGQLQEYGMKFNGLAAALVVSLLLICELLLGGDGLEPGVRLKADGKLIDTDVGHAAPFLFDLDSDGDRDLLVGQFGEGKLKFYFNTGTDKKPVYGKPEWFKIGKEFGKIPSG